MIGLDTNVLVRFVVGDDEHQRQLAADALATLTQEAPGFITQVTMVEFYWVLSRAYRYPREACLTTIHTLLTATSLEFDDGEAIVRALTLAEGGADFADALNQSVMEAYGAEETLTFDRRAATSLRWRQLG